MGHIKNCDRRKSTENCDVYLFVSDMFIYEWLIVYECVDVCEYWAELGLLSGEGTWDKQEGTEGSYKVLVPTKMMMMMMMMIEEDEDNVDDDYNREDDDDKNHNHEDDDNDRQAKRFIAKKPASTNATAVPWD